MLSASISTSSLLESHESRPATGSFDGQAKLKRRRDGARHARCGATTTSSKSLRRGWRPTHGPGRYQPLEYPHVFITGTFRHSRTRAVDRSRRLSCTEIPRKCLYQADSALNSLYMAPMSRFFLDFSTTPRAVSKTRTSSRTTPASSQLPTVRRTRSNTVLPPTPPQLPKSRARPRVATKSPAQSRAVPKPAAKPSKKPPASTATADKSATCSKYQRCQVSVHKAEQG